MDLESCAPPTAEDRWARSQQHPPRRAPPLGGGGGPLLGGVPKGVLLVPLHLGEVELCSRHPLVDVFDVVTGALEVSGGVVGAGDEHLRRGGGL